MSQQSLGIRVFVFFTYRERTFEMIKHKMHITLYITRVVIINCTFMTALLTD